MEHVHQHGLAAPHRPPDVDPPGDVLGGGEAPPPAGGPRQEGGEEGGGGGTVELEFVVQFEEIFDDGLLVRVWTEVVISHSPVVHV